MAKATIKIVSACSEFTPGQLQVLRRVQMVLKEHNLSVEITVKEKKVLTIKSKRA